jgi:outer membrane protein assembly factor BamB
VNRIWILFILLVFTGCSFDTRSGFWTQDKVIKKVEKKITKIFKEKAIIDKELNSKLTLTIDTKGVLKNNLFNNTNNSSLSVFKGDIKKSSKFKFKRINNFNYFEPDLVYDGSSFVFFDDKANLLKFSNNLKIIWKKNIYNKQQKKLKPILTLSLSKDSLIVTDTIGKIYRVNFKTGDLIWKKTNINPFNSEVKIIDNKIYAIDMNNILRCFSLEDGTELWKFNSENTFLKSNKRNSLVIKNKIIYFNNSIGDITAINANNGSLIWQTPTQSNDIYENAFSLKMSDLVIAGEDLIFSNNKNEFYSISLINGVLNWKQNINSSVRPVIVKNLIFTVSNEGYLFTLDKNTGNIIKITDIFDNFKSKKRRKIYPIGFLVGENEILLTTSNGKLLIINSRSGKTVSTLKIDKDKISRPFIFDMKILLVKDNAIIRLN